MRTIFFTPKMRTEQTANHKRQLSMKWVVVTDQHGSRRLRMRWTIARPSVPPTFRSATRRLVQPAMGRGSDPTPGPEARVAIS